MELTAAQKGILERFKAYDAAYIKHFNELCKERPGASFEELNKEATERATKEIYK